MPVCGYLRKDTDLYKKLECKETGQEWICILRMLSRIIMDPENIDIEDLFNYLWSLGNYDEIVDTSNGSEWIKLLFDHRQLMINVFYYSDIIFKESKELLASPYNLGDKTDVEDVDILEQALDQIYQFFKENYLDFIKVEFFQIQNRGILLDLNILINKVKEYCKNMFSIFQEDTSHSLEMKMLLNSNTFHHLWHMVIVSTIFMSVWDESYSNMHFVIIRYTGDIDLCYEF